MAFGNSTSSVEESGVTTLVLPQGPPFHVARPFNSPRLMPRKRPIEPESPSHSSTFTSLADCTPCQKKTIFIEESPVKRQKPELQRDIQLIVEVVPEKSAVVATASIDATEDRSAASEKLQKDHCPRSDLAFEEAEKKAMELFTEALSVYAIEKDEKGEDRANRVAEQWAGDHYDELKSIILSLLPWTGEMEVAAGSSYSVIEFQRKQAARQMVPDKSASMLEQYDHSMREMQHFRKEGVRSQAWMALIAMLGAISAREEKVWLENFDVQDDLDYVEKEHKFCKTKGSARRRAAIREMIPEKNQDEGTSAFASYLLDPRSLHRVAFANSPEGLVPATSITYRRMSLWDALKTMDDGGPLRGAAKAKEWCAAAGRQFAIQDLVFGCKDPEDPEERKSRTPASDLKADGQLRDLLRSKKPVILLDTLAALAPRDACKKYGLSKIVQSELATLFREAKARGEAVVFCLGTSTPHKLAEKVYLRPPLADWGMRCGWLRWRESADVPWAREFKWDSRTAVCLQMP